MTRRRRKVSVGPPLACSMGKEEMGPLELKESLLIGHKFNGSDERSHPALHDGIDEEMSARSALSSEAGDGIEEDNEDEGWSELENLLEDDTSATKLRDRLERLDKQKELLRPTERRQRRNFDPTESLKSINKVFDNDMSLSTEETALESTEGSENSFSRQEPMGDDLVNPDEVTSQPAVAHKPPSAMEQELTKSDNTCSTRKENGKRPRGRTDGEEVVPIVATSSEVCLPVKSESRILDEDYETAEAIRGRKRATTRRSSRSTKAAARMKIQATTVAPNTRTSKTVQSTADRLKCPVCLEVFPPASYFDESDYEKKVLDHIMQCSNAPSKKQNTANGKSSQPEKETVAVKAPARKPSPTKSSQPKKAKSAKKKKPATKKNNGTKSQSVTFKPRIQGTGYTGGAYSYVAARSATSESAGTATTFVDKTGGQRIVDSGHFLAQTWWRKGGQRRKGTAPAPSPVIVPFNLQQCLFDDKSKNKPAEESNDAAEQDEGETTGRRTRGSRRLQSKSDSGGGLTLRCPICGNAFTPNWLGSVTEDVMSRHVAKCTQKMFRGGSTVSAMLHSKKDLPRLFLGAEPLKGKDVKRSNQSNMLTPEERDHRNASIRNRARSTGVLLLQGPQRAVFGLLEEEEQQQQQEHRER